MNLIRKIVNLILNFFKNIYLLSKYKINKLENPNTYKSRINIVIRKRNGNILKKSGKPFSRGKYNYDPKYLIAREKMFLEILDGIIAPKLIAYGDDWIEMEFAGEKISKKNLPSDWQTQIENIASFLNKFDIIHRDIKEENILVKNNKIYLIDFGWSVFRNEDYYLTPREISKIPRELIYENFYALNFFINSLN